VIAIQTSANKFAVLVLTLALCDSCTAQEPKQASVHDQRQAALYQIADRCGLPRSSVPLTGEAELHFTPPPDAKYESVDCALSAMRKSNLLLKMGFVGTEYYSNEAQ
jgi:hypothetical protein